MSSDTVYRRAAIDALCKVGCGSGYCGISCDDVKAIEQLSSADRPQGKWLIEKTIYDNYNYRCSYCDWYECHAYPDVEPYNYCPNCGADMRGEKDD